MEGDIKILKEKIKIIESLCTDDCINKSTVIKPLKYALENLIARYKQLEKENKTLKNFTSYIFNEDVAEFIPTSLVKEKIEELEEEIKPKQDIHQKLCIEVNKIGTETEYDYAMEELSILDDELREMLIKKRVLQDLLERSREDV